MSWDIFNKKKVAELEADRDYWKAESRTQQELRLRSSENYLRDRRRYLDTEKLLYRRSREVDSLQLTLAEVNAQRSRLEDRAVAAEKEVERLRDAEQLIERQMERESFADAEKLSEDLKKANAEIERLNNLATSASELLEALEKAQRALLRTIERDLENPMGCAAIHGKPGNPKLCGCGFCVRVEAESAARAAIAKARGGES